MSIVRQFFMAFLAASFVWTGSAGAMQSHAHEIAPGHSLTIHAVTLAADLAHYADPHAHDHDHPVAPADDEHGGAGHDHEKGVFHVHSTCLVALEAEYPSLTRAAAVQSVEPQLLVVPLHTRSITPADRPPRTLL
jgi:hypothetical protein